MIWTPHTTVATIVERDTKLLMVEESINGDSVFNQPAGHIEKNESILAAARRETLEETGWDVELTAFLGIYTYLATANHTMYYRFCFSASATAKVSEQLDHDIIAAHWLTLEEIYRLPASRLRSPLVTRCIEDYYARPHFPLDAVYEHPIQG
ncbi:MAG: NUDIX hydrolase [Oleiphilus sp.]|nr:MAG: NUDIX hydrolase [Oleiphilus sp.]